MTTIASRNYVQIRAAKSTAKGADGTAASGTAGARETLTESDSACLCLPSSREWTPAFHEPLMTCLSADAAAAAAAGAGVGDAFAGSTLRPRISSLASLLCSAAPDVSSLCSHQSSPVHVNM